jgi:hypothetical protein
MPDEKDAAQEKLESVKKKLPLGTYQHYKGSYYTVFALSLKEDTLDVLVHYYSHEKKTRWSRTIEDFTAHVPEAPYEFREGRFKFIREAHPIQLLRAAGFDSLIEGFEAMSGTFEFFKRIRGG